MRARSAMMDALCSVGWRFTSRMSPSSRLRHTRFMRTLPEASFVISIFASASRCPRFLYFRSMKKPLSFSR